MIMTSKARNEPRRPRAPLPFLEKIKELFCSCVASRTTHPSNTQSWCATEGKLEVQGGWGGWGLGKEPDVSPGWEIARKALLELPWEECRAPGSPRVSRIDGGYLNVFNLYFIFKCVFTFMYIHI